MSWRLSINGAARTITREAIANWRIMMTLNHPTCASPSHPSFQWRSGIEGTVLRVQARLVRRTPIFATCGHRLRAGELPTPAIAPACRSPRGIDWKSSDLGRIDACAPQYSLQAGIHAERADNGSAALCPDVVSKPNCLGFLKMKVSRGGSVRGRDRHGLAGHLSLHQRAPLPFRCMDYRASGPICQRGRYS